MQSMGPRIFNSWRSRSPFGQYTRPRVCSKSPSASRPMNASFICMTALVIRRIINPPIGDTGFIRPRLEPISLRTTLSAFQVTTQPQDWATRQLYRWHYITLLLRTFNNRTDHQDLITIFGLYHLSAVKLKTIRYVQYVPCSTFMH